LQALRGVYREYLRVRSSPEKEAQQHGGQAVPYEELDDLPDSVKRNLPKHAREIYRAAYNSAEEQYGEEERAHRVAWSAVEQKYEKNENGEWVSKED
jgi:cation transport regulator